MSDTAQLLSELAHFDEVEAVTVGHEDQIVGNAPEWSELVLVLTADGRSQSIPMTRHDGEPIIQVLHKVLHPHEHRASPVQRLWAQLDDVMDYLMVDDPEPEDKARAKALATAIAMIAQPWAEEPDLDSVRTEAVERWEARQ